MNIKTKRSCSNCVFGSDCSSKPCTYYAPLEVTDEDIERSIAKDKLDYYYEYLEYIDKWANET